MTDQDKLNQSNATLWRIYNKEFPAVRTPCPSEELLAAYLHAGLEERQHVLLEYHLTHCVACQSLVRDARHDTLVKNDAPRVQSERKLNAIKWPFVHNRQGVSGLPWWQAAAAVV
ncbi:MAG: hypothetical protein KDK34_04285, partial [Leptospiraceae bacterium]|nr:hypothetical protein [Leptospiraceae bacterium]